jgi:hypothetical protein
MSQHDQVSAYIIIATTADAQLLVMAVQATYMHTAPAAAALPFYIDSNQCKLPGVYLLAPVLARSPHDRRSDAPRRLAG